MTCRHDIIRGEHGDVTTDDGEFFELSSCLIRPLLMTDDD